MSPSDMERLIARHLDGAMTVEEEEEFFIRVAIDGELRRALKAQRIVESALRKRLATSPLPPPSAREHLQMMLAGTTASSTGSAVSSAAPTSTTPSPLSGMATALIGALGGLAVITFLSFTLSTSDGRSGTAPTAASPTGDSREMQAAASPLATVDTCSGTALLAGARLDEVKAVKMEIARGPVLSRSSRPAVTGKTGRRPDTAGAVESERAERSAIPRKADTAIQRVTQPVPRISDHDTIRLKVRIDLP